MAIQIQLRHGSSSVWTIANPTLAEGEIGAETDTFLFKVGNGSYAWNSLPYATQYGIHATYAESASWVSASAFITTAQTASYVSAANVVGTVLSSSYATTASFALNGGGLGTTLTTGSSYPITSSWSNNAQSSSYIPSNFGSVTVFHKNGLTTTYNPISDTDISRGNSLITASLNITNGDIIKLSSNIYDIQDNGIDLSSNGTGSISIYGSGKYLTIIKSSRFADSGSIIQPSTNSETCDLSIIANGPGYLQTPWGTKNIRMFENATLRNVYTNGATDGILIFSLTDTGSANIINTTINSNWDCVNIICTGGIFNFYDCNLITRATSSINSGQLANGIIGTGVNINAFNTMISASNGTVQSYAVEIPAFSSAKINLYGCILSTSGSNTSNVYDIANVSGLGIISVTSNTIYNPTKVLNTINYLDSAQIQTSIGSFVSSSISASFSSASISSSYAITSSFALNGGGSGTTLTTGSNYPITSSWATNVVNGSTATYTSSLYGTASWSNNSVSASYALSASWAPGGVGTSESSSWASSSISASYSITASYALNATPTVSSSWASSSLSSSYALSASWAPDVEVNSVLFSTQSLYATQSIYATSASWTSASVSSSYSSTASFALNATPSVSASWASASLSSSYALSASYAPVEPAYSASVSMVKQNTLVTGNTYTITSSWSSNSISSSYSVSASWAPTGSLPASISVTNLTASNAILIGNGSDNSASLYISGSNTKNIIEIDRFDGTEVFIMDRSGSIITPLIVSTGSISLGTATTYIDAITLGNYQPQKISIENSNISSSGQNLTLLAGSTTNYNIQPFVATGQTSRSWLRMAAHWNGNIYATSGTEIYMQTSGSGSFNSLSQTPKGGTGGMCVSKAGNVYSAVSNTDIYMQTSGSGDFNVSYSLAGNWRGMCTNPVNGDVYACDYNGGGIYKQTGGSGTFVQLSSATASFARNWNDMCADSLGNIYASAYTFDIYKQTRGEGVFKRMNLALLDYAVTSVGEIGMVVDNYGNMYVSTPLNAGGDIYFLAENTTQLVHLNAGSVWWGPMCLAPNGNIYNASNGVAGDIYMRTGSFSLADINGGSLVLSSGKGKGAGTSNISFYTGTTLSSSTGVLQTLSEKMTIIGSGNVGIGIASPVNKLDVSGNISCSVITASLFYGTASYASTASLATTTVYELVRKEPNGFPNRTDTTLTYDSASKTFAISGSNFEVYCSGQKYTKNTEGSVIASPVKGTNYYFFYDSTGSLKQSTTAWEINGDAAPVAVVYLGTLAGNGFISDERHGIIMDSATQNYFHDTMGPRYGSGLTYTNISASTGRFQISAGQWHDDDNEFSTGVLTASRQAYYTSSGMALDTSLTNSIWGGGPEYYNNTTLGTKVALTGGQHGAFFLYATNGTNTPLVTVMGQRVDTSVANCRTNNTPDTLVFGAFPYQEAKLLYRIIVNTSGFVEATDYRSAQYAGSTFSPTSHGSLSGLTNDDHPQYLLLAGRSGGQTVSDAVTVTSLTSSAILIGNSTDNSASLYLSGSPTLNLVEIDNYKTQEVFDINAEGTCSIMALKATGSLFGTATSASYSTGSVIGFGVFTIQYITSASYAALSPKVATTLYVISSSVVI